MTSMGMILGTAAYMSPEQARGRAVDKRTDIWAFGAVLYEMLTGARAFEGEDVTDTMAAVLKSTPDWAALPGRRPSAGRHAHPALPREGPRTRASATSPLRDSCCPITHRSSPRPASPPRRISPLVTTLVLLVAAALAAVILRAPPGRERHPASRPFASRSPTTPTDDPSTALSSDGTQIAFVANRDRVPMLWVRPLDAVESRALAGTEGASLPFWSPDGRTIGFFAGNKLKRIECGRRHAALRSPTHQMPAAGPGTPTASSCLSAA